MLPLEKIRVLDVSRVLAGPFCSMILADLGAEVIKVEKPGVGDDTRAWGPPFINGESAYYLSVNRGKKSVTLNLKSEKGKEILYKLAEKSDVFLENFRPGVAAKLGINYESIKQVNPRIVYCSISGFGQTGPYSNRTAYDIIIQGMGGFMGITGEPERPPVRIGVAITDLGTGMYAAIAIISALWLREKTGKGQYLDLSLLDTSVSWMTYMAQNYFATGKSPKPMGSAHPNIVPYQCFKTKDSKYMVLAIGNDNFWRVFCETVGLKDLANKPEFRTNSGRVENKNKLIPLLEKLFQGRNRDEWINILNKAKIPCGPVYKMEEIFKDPQVLHREMLVKVKHPKIGELEMVGTPIKFSETPLKISKYPPLLGEHTEEVLNKLLGYSKKEIEKLRREKVI